MAYVVTSPMNRDACLWALSQNVDGPFVMFGDKPAIGVFDNVGVRLRKRISYRNSFQTVLAVSAWPTPAGTTLECRPELSRIVIGFLVVWVGLVLLIGGPVMFFEIGRMLGGTVGASSFTALAIPVIMILVGGIIVGLGRWLARNEAAFLVQFVASVTGGTVTVKP